MRSYERALRKNRPDEAWMLLSEKIQRQLPLEAFKKIWNDYRSDLVEIPPQLDRRLKEPIDIKAKITYPSGLGVEMVWKKSWKLESGLAALNRTPLEALTAFLAAAEQRNFPALLRLLAKSTRENLERTVQDRVEKLRRALQGEIEVVGNRASIQLDPGSRIDLLFEDGQWKILFIN